MASTKLPAKMRTYHRWISAVAAVFLIVVAVTGVILQVQHLGGEEEREGRERAALTTAMPTPIYAALVARTLDAARQRAPNAAVQSVILRSSGTEIRGAVRISGDPMREIVVNAQTGRVLRDEMHEAESIVMRIHSGEILGEAGVVLGILWGMALVLLLVSGSWVYIDMYRRRLRGTAKRGLFW